jgi:hypothetical protein
MFQTVESWKVADHDDTEIYSADGRIYIGACASRDDARLAAAAPSLLALAVVTAESVCACTGTARCTSCEAQRIILSIF